MEKLVNVESKSLAQEDIEFTLIWVIQTFFDQNVPSEDLQTYFKALNDLIDETTKLIEKEIQYAEELALKGDETPGEEIKLDSSQGSMLVNSFMSGPKSLPRDIKTKLYTLSKDLIMNEMYDKHRSIFRKISL
jgi:hypothetical protein